VIEPRSYNRDACIEQARMHTYMQRHTSGEQNVGRFNQLGEKDLYMHNMELAQSSESLAVQRMESVGVRISTGWDLLTCASTYLECAICKVKHILTGQWPDT